MTGLVSESEPYRSFKDYLIPSGLFNQQEKEPLTMSSPPFLQTELLNTVTKCICEN